MLFLKRACRPDRSARNDQRGAGLRGFRACFGKGAGGAPASFTRQAQVTRVPGNKAVAGFSSATGETGETGAGF
ncbi:hypothetical protein GCM10010435_71810 [Winogradskya consettensis]|uniref:Uncharacterized protein n=1 Tax=Winogradskya consettensis TaxID=113560 RepID=A0A919SUA8_9ACTN|nr:hypothetical protein Aco04nite_56420 [Actinoplanes consettensis]